MTTSRPFRSHIIDRKIRAAVVTGLILMSFTACQSVSSSPDITPAVYTGSDNQFQATDPDKIAAVRTQLAAQLIREKKLDAAQRQLDRALDADKNHAPAYDMMGVLLQQEGSRLNLQRADAFFRQAIAIDPKFMQARNNYGVYLARMGRDADAVAQFEIAGAALGYEGRVGALENLGRTALKIDDQKTATKAFLRALNTDPNSLIAHIELVDLLIKNDRIGQAQQLYESMLVLLGPTRANTPRILLQGVKLAHARGDASIKQKLSQQLFSQYPLSPQAKQLKQWMLTPAAAWR